MVGDEVVLRAASALRKVCERRRVDNKNKLFDEPEPVLLQIECVKVPKCASRKLRFRLPHRLPTESSEVCLFVSDLKKGRRVEHEPIAHRYEDLLREKGVDPVVKTVVPVRQLRVEFDQLETKRRLLTQHDYFLVDARVCGLVNHKLGSTFCRKNALPTPVKIDDPELIARNVRNALHKTVMWLRGSGNCVAVNVANGYHTDEQICENVQAVLKQLDEQYPGGWANVRSVYMKKPRSIAIPVYVTLKNKNKVQQPVVQPLHSREIVEDELSTIPGLKVKVHPDGKVETVGSKLQSDEEQDVEDAKESAQDETEQIADESDEEENSEVTTVVKKSERESKIKTKKTKKTKSIDKAKNKAKGTKIGKIKLRK